MQPLLEKLYAQDDLSYDEARHAALRMLAADTDPVLVAAYLVALKLKGETAAEIAGTAAALTSLATPIDLPPGPIVDTCGTGGDGQGTVNVSTATALVLAEAGLAVVKHGNRAVSSQAGSADVLAALGLPLALPAEAHAQLLRAHGITFLFAPHVHPALARVMPVRRALQTRTVFNLVGPLANPARPTHQVLGVGHVALLEPLARALAVRRDVTAFVVHCGGLDEFGLHAPNRVIAVEQGALRPFEFDARTLGLAPVRLADLKGGDAPHNAAALRAVLGGRDRGPHAHAVALNAAAGLLLTGRAADWPAAYQQADAILCRGAAEARLDRWLTAARELAP